MEFCDYRLCDSKELVTARWLCRENALRIKALENKLTNSDPDSPDWAKTSAKLYASAEHQKELVEKKWVLEWSINSEEWGNKLHGRRL